MGGSDLIERIQAFTGATAASPSCESAFARILSLLEELGGFQKALGDVIAASCRPSGLKAGEALAAELRQEIERVCIAIGDSLLALTEAGGRLQLAHATSAPAPARAAASPTQVLLAHEDATRAAARPQGPRSSLLSLDEQSSVLRELVDTLGAPKSQLQEIELLEEVARMDDITQAAALERWGHMPAALQQSFIAMIVARARDLKTRLPLPPLAWKQLNEILSRLPPYSKLHNPGYINGLKLSHQPEHASWLEDACDHFRVLERGLEQKPAFEGTLRSAATSGMEAEQPQG